MGRDNGWRETTIGDEAELLTGFPFKSRDYTESDDGIKLLRGDNIAQGHLRWSGVKRWPAASASQYDSYFLEAGDIVLAMDRPWIEAGLKYGCISNHDRPCLLVQRVSRLRGGPGLDAGFLRYLIGSREFTQHVLAVQTGTAVPHISSSQIKEFSFSCPPLSEQRAIASILGSLDDKIELNRRMNETLEGIARALFKSWFVDFDPVRAKMDGRQPNGMSPQIANLFPSEFEHVNGELVPKGWNLSSASDVIEINPARRLPKGSVATYLDMKNMPTNGHHPDEWTLREMGSGTKFINGDTLMARITPCLENGKTAFVDFLNDGETGWGSTEYIVLRPRPPLPVEFGYYLARSEEFRLHAITNMTGSSGRQRVPNDCLTQFVISMPPAAIAFAFGKIVRSLMNSIRGNCDQSRIAASLRDTLLSKLLSGELRVPDADKMLEEVL